MDWLAFLHVICLLPSLGLIFGTSCCCFVCITCVSGTLPQCSNTTTTVTYTISGIVDGYCVDCDDLNGTYVKSTFSSPGCNHPLETTDPFTTCSGAVLGHPVRQIVAGLSNVGCTSTSGTFRAGFSIVVSDSTGPPAPFIFGFTKLFPYTNTEDGCADIGTLSDMGAPSHTGSGCDVSGASATVEIANV